MQVLNRQIKTRRFWIISLTNLVVGFIMGLAVFGFREAIMITILCMPFIVTFILRHCYYETYSKWTVVLTAPLISACFVVVFRIEGLICVLLSLPLVYAGAFLGYFIAGLINKNREKGQMKINTKIMFFIGGVLFLKVGANIETSLPAKWHSSASETSCIISGSPSELWQRVELLEGYLRHNVNFETKSFIVKYGVPMPISFYYSNDEFEDGHWRFDYGEIGVRFGKVKPTLYEQKYFDRGGHGKRWLQIQSSSWAMQNVADGVKVTHAIRWKSSLNPTIYWKLMEGVASKAVSHYLLTELNSITLPAHETPIEVIADTRK